MLVISRRMTQTILTLLALSSSIVATPVFAEVDVTADLISFARWTSQGPSTAGEEAYILRYAGDFSCPDFEGSSGNLLRFNTQVTQVCQIGEVTGTEANDIWDRTVKLTWANADACNANTRLFFGGQPVVPNRGIGVSPLPDCEASLLRNYQIPSDLTGLDVDGKIAVKLGMDIGDGDSSQDLIIGYWTPAASSTPDCSDESIDWTTAATEDGWSCTVDGTEYEYADFHILTTIDSQPDVCATPDTLPTDENNGQGVFCAQEDNTVRAIYDWNNATQTKLTWLLSVEQIGSRLEAGVGCGAAARTTAGRCANQLKSGFRAFREMQGIGGPGISALDVSNLTDIGGMFQGAKAFNEDLTQWETGHVRNMPYVFQNAQAFNQPLLWDTSKVEVMSYMFDRAYKFNQPLSDWDTTSVRRMTGMFQSAEDFNRNLSAWANQLTQLQNMENMFKNASAFNNGSTPGASDQPLNWTAPNLGLMNYAFAYATSFNQQIFADGASTANVTNMSGMFKGATAFNQNIGGWNTQSLDKAASMFEGATAFNKDIGNWSMGSVTNMNAMFKNAEAFNQDLSGWVLGNRAIDLSSFDEGADTWCGLGFRNRGRPDAVSPSEAESCALSLVIDAPESAVAGDQFDYVLRYYNESATDLNSGALSLTLPTGLSLVDAGAGTATG